MELKTLFPTPLGEIEIGDGLPPHLIAEIGLNHNGSVELARQMIHQAALSGATFVKFQKRSPADLADAAFLDAPFPKCPAFGRTQRQVRERLELSMDVYRELRAYAESLGLVFCCTPFDLPSLDFLLQVGTPVIKVASHSVTNGPLLEAIAATNLPVICSLGGATAGERDQAVAILTGSPLVLMHCVSAYPTPDHLALLDTIPFLKQRYRVPVGFSSHENGIDVSVAASLLGASLIERHFTLNRAMLGLDQGISLEPSEFAEMGQRIRRLAKCRGVKTDYLADEAAAKTAYHVGLYTLRPLKAGSVITEEDLAARQPLQDSSVYFTGLEKDRVIGRKLSRALPAGTLLSRDSLETS